MISVAKLALLIQLFTREAMCLKPCASEVRTISQLLASYQFIRSDFHMVSLLSVMSRGARDPGAVGPLLCFSHGRYLVIAQ